MFEVLLQELLALPAITPSILAKFESDVAGTGSEKEQRLIIRRLLMQSGELMTVYNVATPESSSC